LTVESFDHLKEKAYQVYLRAVRLQTYNQSKVGRPSRCQETAYLEEDFGKIRM